MAERLGRALQKLLQRFKSARDLKRSLLCENKEGIFYFEALKTFVLKARKNKKDRFCLLAEEGIMFVKGLCWIIYIRLEPNIGQWQNFNR
ncbi:MAG: hypothetical protein JWP12_508 [Bacteroidetes bacterium]|nr:hypothetical protein [Bacteroidota bacterium]